MLYLDYTVSPLHSFNLMKISRLKLYTVQATKKDLLDKTVNLNVEYK